MNFGMWILTLLFSTSAFAVQIYTIDTNQTMGREELGRECSKDTESSKERLIQIARDLKVPSDSLTVNGQYGVVRQRTGSTRVPNYSYQYYCLLDFRSKDPAIEIKRNTVVRYTRLGRRNWETACEPSYQEALSNPYSPVSVLWTAWTLIQGRMCEVETITIKRNEER